MPTCETATVKIDDRGGKFSSPSADVEFTFDPKNARFIEKITILKSSKVLKAPSKKRSGDKDFPMKPFGSCDAGAGNVIVNGGSEKRLFLITKFRPKSKRSKGKSCCEAEEVLLARSITELDLDELLLLFTRLASISIGLPAPSNCTDEPFPI
jgi:hypothetical protein